MSAPGPEFSAPAYTLPENTFQEISMAKKHGETQFYGVQDHPELIARDPYLISDQTAQAGMEQLADCLSYLSGQYGIDFPAIGNSIPEAVTLPDGSHDYRTFTTVPVVDGLEMRESLGAIPPEVTADVLDRMLRYYQDAAQDTSGRLYLTDLSLKQCIYGTLRDSKEEAPRPYFVDLERLFGNMSTPVAPYEVSLADGAKQLSSDLLAFKRRFPQQNVEGLAERVASLGQTFDFFVPYYG